MKYRIAKQVDCKALVNLHYAIRKTYSVGFFSKLGKCFLTKYYEIILNDPNSVIVCAEDNKGIVQGFCSATLDVTAQMDNIRRHKVGLGLAAFTSIILHPSLLKDLLDRYKVVKNDSSTKMISTKGARSEYWVWLSTNRDSASSVGMYFAQLNILKSLGVKEFFGEVDKVNNKILKFQLRNGGEIIDEITLPDGRERVILRVDLNKWR